MFINQINGYMQALQNFDTKRLRPETKLGKLRFYRDRHNTILTWANAVRQNRIRNHKSDITNGLLNKLEDFKAEILRYVPKKEPKLDTKALLAELLENYRVKI